MGYSPWGHKELDMMPGSCCWKAHLRGWWGRPAAEEPRRRMLFIISPSSRPVALDACPEADVTGLRLSKWSSSSPMELSLVGWSIRRRKQELLVEIQRLREELSEAMSEVEGLEANEGR